MSERTLNLIKDNDVRWVDLRFTDTRGKEQHVSIPATEVDEDFFEYGNDSYMRLTSYMSATNEGLSNNLPAGNSYWKREGKSYHINRLSQVEDSSQFLFADFIRFHPFKNK